MEERVKIAEIDIGVDKLLSKASATEKQLATLKASQKALKKETNNLTTATQEQAEQYTKNDIEAKKLNKEIRNSKKVLDAYINIQNKEIKTKTEAREANSKLIAIANELDSTNEDHIETLERINNEIDNNTDFIKDQSSEYEKTKINIGNYKESILEALGAGQASQAATEGMTAAQSLYTFVVGKSTGAMKLFKIALASTGIGLLVIALASLVSYLFTTQEGINKVNKVLTPLKILFSSLLGVVQDLGKDLFEALSNPKQLIKDIGNLVKENLINRFQAFGKIIDAIMEGDFGGIADGLLQAATGVKDLTGKLQNMGKDASKFFQEAIDRGKEIEAIKQALSGTEADYITLQAKLKKQFEEQKKISEDTTKSQAEREAAARRAITVQEEISKGTIERIKLEGQLIKLKQQSNDISDTERAELATKLAEIDQALEEEAAKTTEAQNQLNSIVKEGVAKRVAAAKAATEAAIAESKTRLQIFIEENEGQAKSLADGLDYAEKLRDKKLAIFKDELDAKKLTESEYELAVLQEKNAFLERQSELTIEYANKELEIFKSNHQSKIDSQALLTEALVNEEQRRLDLIAQQEREYQTKRLEEGKISQMEYNAAINAIDEQNRLAKAEQEQALKEQQAEAAAVDLENKRAIEMENFFVQMELEKQRLEIQKQQEIAHAEAVGASTALVKQKYAAIEKDIEAEKKAFKINAASQTFANLATILGKESAAGKAAAIAMTTIDTYQAATAAYAAMAGIPIVGPALGAIAAAAAVAAGLKTVQKITSTKKPKIPKAEKGASFDIKGRSHSQGGETFYDESGNAIVEAQGGEKMVILKREASKELAALSALNQKHGGVSLSKPVTYANNGGAVLRPRPFTASKTILNPIDYELMGTVLAEKVNAIQTVVPVDKVTDIAFRTAQVEQGANL